MDKVSIPTDLTPMAGSMDRKPKKDLEKVEDQHLQAKEWEKVEKPWLESEPERPSMAEVFPLDEELLNQWKQMEALLFQALSMASRGGIFSAMPKNAGSVNRGSNLNNRTLGLFVLGGWIHNEDYRTIATVKHYALMVAKARPLYEEWIKHGSRGPIATRVQGSILTIPPAPVRERWLPGLIKRATITMPKLKKMSKDLKGSDGKKRFEYAINPKRMGESGRKRPKIGIPAGVPGVFQPLAT